MWGPERGWKDTDTSLLGSLTRISIYSGNTLAELELEIDNIRRKMDYMNYKN
jgi:hypothetical protein